MTNDFHERFPGVNVDDAAKGIAAIVLETSQLTDDFSTVLRIPRLRNGERENDVVHSYMLAVAAPAIANQYYPGLDVGKVERLSLVHDMLELVVGDVATFDLSPAELQEKARREQAAKSVVLKRLSAISENLAQDLEDYERQDCLEAQFVRMVDKLLPVAVDSTGDGLRVIREDYGIQGINDLETSHGQLNARLFEKFGRAFPDLVGAHAVLVTAFEQQYRDNPNASLRVREIARGPVETERKFLVDRLPDDIDLEAVPHAVLRQGYVVINSDGAETRVRSFDNERFELTVKSPGTIQRGEQTIKLSKDMFEVLWSQTVGRRVEKTRYNIPYGKYTIELDVYDGHLTGLMTAEVEFSGRAEDAAVRAEVFEPPMWFGREVTSDRRYKNQNLAQGAPREPLNLGAKQL